MLIALYAPIIRKRTHMKIVHIISSMDPAFGGPPVVVANISCAQAQLGHSVLILCHELSGNKSASDALLHGLPGSDQVGIQEVPNRSFLTKVVGGELKTDLDTNLDDVDVIHIHGLWSPLGQWASVLARKRGIPYVVTVHGMLDPWCLRQKAIKKRLAFAAGYRKMLDGALFIQAHSEREANQAQEFGFKAPAIVIPNGVNPVQFDSLPAPGTFRALHPELGGDQFILFLARLHYKKGLDLLADGFGVLAQHNKQVRLVVAGPSGDSEEGFRNQIQRLGLAPRVLMPGPIYGEEKLAALVDAACFCLPSRQEGFSIAIVEALAARLPVVLSESCYFPQAADNDAGIQTTLEAESIAAGLHQVLDDQDHALLMGENGHNLVVSRYTWCNIGSQLIDAYQ
ncbi:MAG: glycosyltransferase [Phycisphaerales bacterium]